MDELYKCPECKEISLEFWAYNCRYQVTDSMICTSCGESFECCDHCGEYDQSKSACYYCKMD